MRVYLMRGRIYKCIFLLLKTETSNSADWNSSPGATVASTTSTQSGQQQLATETGAQVVPVQANYSLTQPSLTSAEQSYINGSSSVSSPQSSVSSYNSAAPASSNSTVDNGYPVYYVSSTEEPKIHQPASQPVSNATADPLSSSTTNASLNTNDNNYPVYYVSSASNESQQTQGVINTTSLPPTSTESATMSNNTDKYPIYYVSSYNEKTPQTPTATTLNGNNTFVNASKGNTTLDAQVYSYPVYNVGSSTEGQEDTSQTLKTKFINSPVSYEIINSTSASQGVISQLNVSSSSSVATPATYSQPSPTNTSYASSPASPSATQAPASAPASQPATTSYNYPAAPPSYQTNSVASSSSTTQQTSNYYGSPARAPSPATYQAYGTPSSSAYPSPAPAPQPAPSYYSYPASQASAAPSSSPSSAQSPAQHVASSYPSTAVSPARAPAPAPTSAPAQAPIRISGVSSSPPFPPASGSSSSPGKNQSPAPAQTSSSKPYSSSLPTLNSEYENASYIIATPPEKDTVLFLPSPLHPFLSEETKAGNSTSDGSSIPAATNASAINNTSSQQINETSLLNTTVPEIPTPANATNIKVESSNSTIPTLKITNASTAIIPKNISFPSFSNMTSISNSSLEPPPSTPAPVIPISSTTLTTEPPPTTQPIIEFPPVASVAPVVPPQSNDTLNIPLGPQLNSPPVVMTKPPPSHLYPTPPPVPVVHPVPVTTKPPPTVGLHTTAKAKAKEWGFGDKYLGMS